MLPDGSMTAKHFHLIQTERGPRVRLTAANPRYPDMEFAPEEIRVEAIVIESVRLWV
jgi:SOS-response transcriptional repressor LexA